jgi:hypothetical protein
VPRKTGTAVTTGRFVHKAFESYFKEGGKVGDHLAALLESIDPRYLNDRARKAYADAERLIEPLTLWSDRYPIERTLEVEQAFEIPMTNGLILQGRPDRVVVCYERIWHFQHKTLAATRKPDLFIELAKHSFHELLYAYHLIEKYKESGLNYGGSIFNVVRKVKYRSDAKGPKHGTIINGLDRLFIQRHITLSQAEIDAAWWDVFRLSQAMRDTADRYSVGILPPRNRHFDSGYYGNGVSPYLPVVLGDIDLDDDSRFMDRINLYDTEEEE